jgi:hypothetical protein
MEGQAQFAHPIAQMNQTVSSLSSSTSFQVAQFPARRAEAVAGMAGRSASQRVAVIKSLKGRAFAPVPSGAGGDKSTQIQTNPLQPGQTDAAGQTAGKINANTL